MAVINPSDPAEGAVVAVTATAYAASRAIRFDAAGDVTLTCADASSISISVVAGELIPLRVVNVTASTCGVGEIHLLY
jgi:hypothetical protein